MNTARDGQTPSMPSSQGADFSAAAYAAIGILSAYIRRQRTAGGCFIEVPMLQSAICAANVGMSGVLARRAGYSGKPEMEPWGRNPRYNIYPTRDEKFVTVCLLEYRAWKDFCSYINRSDLAPPEEWAERHTSHGERAASIRTAISEFCKSRDRDALVAEMTAARIAICAIYTADEAIAADHIIDSNIIGFTDHPVEGRVPFFVDPLARAGLSDPTRLPSPALDEHGPEIRNRLRIK
jgi:crotonobetainyl-CoA:carnitine CoA-transferase CaiB-like acyl-CoA transferase